MWSFLPWSFFFHRTFSYFTEISANKWRRFVLNESSTEISIIHQSSDGKYFTAIYSLRLWVTVTVAEAQHSRVSPNDFPGRYFRLKGLIRIIYLDHTWFMFILYMFYN